MAEICNDMDQEPINIVTRQNAGRRDAVFRILQITDCHLSADPEWTLAGVNTQTSLNWVMSLAEHYKSETDLLLLTGDLVHDASIEGYARLRRQLQQFGIPACCLPGNHDRPEVLYDQLQNGLVTSPPSVALGNWIIVLLDSTQPDSEGGHLRASELHRLEATLKRHPDHHALIALHHHPIPIDSHWMDKMSLDNPRPFLQLIGRFPSVKGVVWGHIHQVFESQYQDIRMMGTPSTCIQFEEKRDQFGLSCIPPGLRWLDLHANGQISSGVERVESLPPGLDLKTAGY